MGSAKSDSETRRKLRKKLVAEGLSPAAVDAVISRKAAEQLALRPPPPPPTPPRARPPGTPPPETSGQRARRRRRANERRQQEAQDRELELARAERERQHLEDETYRRLSLDDSKFRPARPDPLTTGSARVTGATARAVRRRNALTKWEIEGG